MEKSISLRLILNGCSFSLDAKGGDAILLLLVPNLSLVLKSTKHISKIGCYRGIYMKNLFLRSKGEYLVFGW